MRNKKYSQSINAQSYARWRDDDSNLIGQLFDIDGDPQTFHAEHKAVFLPGLAVGSFDYSSMTYDRTAQRIRKEPCDLLFIQSIASGGLDLDCGDQTVSARRGRAIFMDVGRPHTNASLATSGRCLMIGRDGFAGARLDALQGAVAQGARQRVLDDYIAWLLGALRRAPLTAMARTEEAAAAVVMACFDPASPIQEPARDALGAIALARARRYIEAHAAEPLDVSAVAAAACVSRATLYRLFKPFGGVAEYLWRARLELARQRLSDPTLRGSIGAIAAEVGFTSDAHFSRRFSEAYGFSPRNLRPF